MRCPLSARDYIRLRRHRPPTILDSAWSEWEKLGDEKEGEKQHMMQWNQAKDIQDCVCLYEIVWDGTHGTEEQCGEFESQCIQTGVNEINAMLERGVNWNDLTWTTAEELEELYKPLPVAGYGCARQRPIFHEESCTGEPLDIACSCKRQARKGKEKVVYGTTEPESKTWRNRLVSLSPEL
jgi:hypothetical protein